MSLQRSAAGVGVARGLGLAAAVGFMLYVAHRFGSTRATDIAFNALIIPNALMAMISTLLPPILTSVFKSIEMARGPEEAWAFARSAPRLAAMVSAAVTGVGVLASPLLARGVAAGFAPEEIALASRYMQAAFMVIFFSGLSSVLKGLLNANGVLFVPSLDTMATNAVGIVIAALASDRWGVSALVAAAVGGGASKALIMLPQWISRRHPGPAGVWHPEMRRAAGLLGPVVLSSLLMTMMAGVLRAYASQVPAVGAVSHLTYAERIYSAPVDLFVASLGVALLPALSEHAAAGERERVRHLTTVGLRMSAFFGIPAAVGLWLLAEPIVALLCQHGQFDAQATAGTARALRGYAPALAFSGHLLLYQAFYAMGRTRAILASGATLLVGTATMGALLYRSHGQGGIALAFSTAYVAGFVVSLVLFAREVGMPDVKGLASGAVRTSLCAGMMGAALVAMGRWAPVSVLLRILAGAVVFAAFARFACPEEWNQARKLWARSDT